MNSPLYTAGGSHFAYANTNKTAIQRPAIQAAVSLCRATREIAANLMPSVLMKCFVKNLMIEMKSSGIARLGSEWIYI
jgi:hypothetical protein